MNIVNYNGQIDFDTGKMDQPHRGLRAGAYSNTLPYEEFLSNPRGNHDKKI
jgi:hypothetical protein